MKTIGVGDMRLSNKAKANVLEVLESNRLSYGKFTRAFEKATAEAHDCDHAVFCSSGTAALHMAVAAMKELHGWDDGDEVIVPALTFPATANALIHCGLKPVLVDVCEETYNINVVEARRAVTSRTRAIMPVHMHGLPADMPRVMELADECDLVVIEDACEAWFSRIDGKRVCSYGDVGCLSTYVSHTISAGIGGFALTNDAGAANVMRSFMTHGFNPRTMNDPFGRREFQRVGHNFRATELEAAIGLAEMSSRSDEILIRRYNVTRLTEALSPVNGFLQLPSGDLFDAVYMVYPMMALTAESCAGIRAHLHKHRIETRKMWTLELPAQTRVDTQDRFWVTRLASTHGFYVGCHSGVTFDDVDRIARVIGEYFDA